ncbi:glycosyl hydrolase family 18 protein [Halocella sp. SP3-1]|uniref:glycosyl hydrolase family 18 protein n=1 Tax=Halocella sp. SP3-1 TaxID=2382161 RepID=UPI000F75D7C5|nr:glycosyl hydrolase family 18 protein [Halocella sp. SP3-1]AZO93235.1 hypothetical protein D7D81_00770 [Halocella sp. SP3-1]
MFIVLGYHLLNNKKGLSSIMENSSYLNKILPTWLEIKENGSLLIKDFTGELSLIAGHYNVEEIIPLLQNYQLASKVSNIIIEDDNSTREMLADLIPFLNKYGFQGININMEGVKYSNKEPFTEFIKKVTSKLHEHNIKIGLSIPAKVENNKDSTWSGAYDYHILGEIVDSIIIMAYDYHWPGGPPGPIAPLNWIQDVIDYAIIEIPIEKIFLALGLYGYDWTIDSDKRASGLIYSQVMNIASKYKLQIDWDQESSSPYFLYKENNEAHEVWFENKVSIARKLKLIQEYQLAGVAFWRPGQEDPGIWQLITEVK